MDFNKEENIRLSASTAGVWTKCAMSAKLPSRPRDIVPAPEIAERGTRLHDYAARMIKGEKVNIPNPEEELAVRFYLSQVKSMTSKYKSADMWRLVERRIEVTEGNVTFVGIPDYATILRDRKGRYTLLVVDLKTGYSPVPADCLQMLLYAELLGLYYRRSEIYVKSARLATVMTMTNTVNYAEYELRGQEYLEELANFINFSDTFNTGTHCRLCQHVTTCPALSEVLRKLTSPAFRGQILRKPEDFSYWWQYKKVIDSFYDTLQREIVSLDSMRATPPGLKVETKPGRRVWNSDVDIATVASHLGLAEDAVVEKKLLSPAQLEAKLSKDKTALIKELTYRTQSVSVNLDLDSSGTDFE